MLSERGCVHRTSRTKWNVRACCDWCFPHSRRSRLNCLGRSRVCLLITTHAFPIDPSFTRRLYLRPLHGCVLGLHRSFCSARRPARCTHAGNRRQRNSRHHSFTPATPTVHATMMRYEPQTNKNCLRLLDEGGGLGGLDVRRFARAGSFEVEVWQGCGKGHGGSDVAVEVGG